MDSEDVVGGLSCAQTCFNEKDYAEITQLIQQIPAVEYDPKSDLNIEAERIIERYQYILDLYLEQPHLLDSKIPEIFVALLKLTDYKKQSIEIGQALPPVSILAFKFIWQLCKVRKLKSMSKFLPHEVADFLPVLGLLEKSDMDIDVVCMLLLWLKLLCKIPFDLNRFDAQLEGNSKIIERLLNIGKRYFEMSNKSCELSAYMMCELIIRPDVKKAHLKQEILSNTEAICKLDLTIHEDQVRAVGKCIFLAAIFKHAKREDLLGIGKLILDKLETTKLYTASEIFLRKLSAKLVQRIGVIYLPQKIASWRYQRGVRSLAQNLDGISPAQTSIVVDNSGSEDTDYCIRDEVETVIQLLLNWLMDRDTVVRWSAAKGIGRITARLPKELADEVCNSVLESFNDSMSDSAWHGGCLAIAEMARRGLILPQKLEDVIKMVNVALTYDKQLGRHSVGKHVRDAACYVCWAFARAFEPNILKPFVKQLSVNLMTVALFDREVNCRRAASAAFQENVGRQGNMPHGIEILTIADYFTVGNRIHCYNDISIQVAKHEEYRQKFVEHLLKFKIGHWDLAIRQLASSSLGHLCKLDPVSFIAIVESLISKTIDNDIFIRQGALFAIGDIYAAISGQNVQINTEILESIAMIPSKCQSFFKNLGGEMTRVGVNYLIQKLASSEFPVLNVKNKEFETWLSIIRDGLRNQDVNLRNTTAECVKSVSKYILQVCVCPITAQQFVEESFRRIRSQQEVDRIGGILCVGNCCIEVIQLAESMDTVVDVLCQHTVITSTYDKLWADARMEAVTALDRLVPNLSPLPLTLCVKIAKTYLSALDDYTLDSRGDIGKIVRVAAIKGLQNLVLLALQRGNNEFLSQTDLLNEIMHKILQQCCEKIDSVRETACNTVTAFVTPGSGDSVTADCSDGVTVLKYLKLDDLTEKLLIDVFTSCDHVKWLSGREAFSRLAPMLKSKYQKSVLLGFIISAGCITESTRKSASDALLDYVKEISDDETKLKQLLETVGWIFEENQALDRIVSPLLVCIDILLSSNYFEVFYGTADQVTSLELILKLTLLTTARKRSPVKVIAGLTVCSSMMQFESTSKVYDLAIKQLLRALSHPFPIVRKEAANQLYGSLLTYGTLDNHSEQCIGLLTQSEWDSADIDGLREIRDAIKELLHVE